MTKSVTLLNMYLNYGIRVSIYVIFIPFAGTPIVGFFKRGVSIEYHVKVLYTWMYAYILYCIRTLIIRKKSYTECGLLWKYLFY